MTRPVVRLLRPLVPLLILFLLLAVTQVVLPV